MKANRKYFIIGIIIILVDQITKFFMIDKYITIIPNFLNFTYTKNQGAAFGIGSNTIIMIASIILILGLIFILVKYSKKITCKIPFVIVISGAASNLIDRVFRGYVIDFIDVNLFNFPNFNVADICVTLGIFIIIINLLKNINK